MAAGVALLGREGVGGKIVTATDTTGGGGTQCRRRWGRHDLMVQDRLLVVEQLEWVFMG